MVPICVARGWPKLTGRVPTCTAPTCVKRASILGHLGVAWSAVRLPARGVTGFYTDDYDDQDVKPAEEIRKRYSASSSAGVQIRCSIIDDFITSTCATWPR